MRSEAYLHQMQKDLCGEKKNETMVDSFNFLNSDEDCVNIALK